LPDPALSKGGDLAGWDFRAGGLSRRSPRPSQRCQRCLPDAAAGARVGAPIVRPHGEGGTPKCLLKESRRQGGNLPTRSPPTRADPADPAAHILAEKNCESEGKRSRYRAPALLGRRHRLPPTLPRSPRDLPVPPCACGEGRGGRRGRAPPRWRRRWGILTEQIGGGGRGGCLRNKLPFPTHNSGKNGQCRPRRCAAGTRHCCGGAGDKPTLSASTRGIEQRGRGAFWARPVLVASTLRRSGLSDLAVAGSVVDGHPVGGHEELRCPPPTEPRPPWPPPPPPTRPFRRYLLLVRGLIGPVRWMLRVCLVAVARNQ
jgi:hypothetical protein